MSAALHHVHGFWHVANQRSAKHERIIGNLCLVVQPWVVSANKCYQVFKISQYLHEWINHSGIASGYQHCVELDYRGRRWVRMAYWRQWCEPRTKIRNLKGLGVHVQAAVACGITSKGPWRSSKTPGVNQAIPSAYLKSQGLCALRDGWVKLHNSQ